MRGGYHLHNLSFVLKFRISDGAFQHETVALCFRQKVGSLLVDRVLCSQDEEWFRKLHGFITDGYLLFLHRFQKCRLHFRRSPVDFICQNEIGENRSALGAEIARLGIIDHGANHVRRQEVRRELNAVESRLQAFRQGRHREGLGQTRHALNQHVVVAHNASNSRSTSAS
ncbi:hypothetical protein SDC9_189086 [bioreactor metagenome]|uniref:Uncharacterized protein n=1 Tax=bioreactor metagenome TaxID=1076179 RepID=A0A645HZG1_9ZZZZ